MKVHVFKRGILTSDYAIGNYRNLKVVYCGYLDVQDPFDTDLWNLCNWSCWSNGIKPVECEHLQITHCNSDVSYCINGTFYSHEMHKFHDFDECYNEMRKESSNHFWDVYGISYGFEYPLDESDLQYVNPDNITQFIK